MEGIVAKEKRGEVGFGGEEASCVSGRKAEYSLSWAAAASAVRPRFRSIPRQVAYRPGASRPGASKQPGGNPMLLGR